MTAPDGETGLEIATAFEFDSILLDINLPGMDGYQLLKALRASARMTPVLVLTARDAEDDMIRGLDLGADDYLTKPFSFLELVARLHSITRHVREQGDGTIAIEDVVVDPMRHTVTRNGSRVDLTRLELLLLVSLAQNAGQCVSRRVLTQTLWGSDHAVSSSALDVLVNSLRAKIDAPHLRKLIATVRGLGYIFSTITGQQERASR